MSEGQPAPERRLKNDEAWPEEIEAMKNIKSGRTKMVHVTAEEFLAELKELENV